MPIIGGDNLNNVFSSSWFLNLRKTCHFIMTVLMYSICLIMIIIFLFFVVNFVDKVYNLKTNTTGKSLFSAYTIVSPSMVPSIHVLDVVVTMRVNDSSSLKKGDIITFTSSSYSNANITHRIYDIERTSNGDVLYVTKGDNNNTPDTNRVNFNDVYGKVLFKIPKIGYIQYYLGTIFGWIVIIVVPAIMIIGYDIFKLLKSYKKKKKEGIEKIEIKKEKKEGRFQ